MYIREIVHLDKQGKFIPAVQLSDFDSPQDNLGLVKSYIFANSTPDSRGLSSRAVGSIDLLKDLRLSYVNGSSNRFVVVANYGHGKSHLAVVLANYFGKPCKSTEVEEVLRRIDAQLQNNQPEAENFKEFKEQYGEFLVVRLRGDVVKTLREQFFPALTVALKEHSSTENTQPPFWNTQAIEWLNTRANDDEAEAFLQELETDVPSLLKDVQENRLGAYEQYANLFAHLNSGVRPNPESNYDLREAVHWVTDNLCIKDKQLSGMLVLFDEFSQFIERYGRSDAIGDLQNLLDGIGDRKGKALFLALSPLDPAEVADRIQTGQTLQNIKRELGRVDRNYSLYSLMESVLGASMNVSHEAWERLLTDNPDCKGRIYTQATELAWSLYRQRYDRDLRWGNDKFRQVVTEGCFPFHPLTTALLCHLRMQGTDNDPRTILRFVRELVEQKQDEPAIKDGKVNWVLPTQIVDYFGEQIARHQLFESYRNAVENLERSFGADGTQVQRDVLKALLLQSADGLPGSGSDQIELISQMTGLDLDTTKNTLWELSGHSIIRFDSESKSDSFWPAAVNPQALEKRIAEYLSGHAFANDELLCLNSQLDKLLSGSNKIEVNIKWGNSSDWAARAIVVTKNSFSPEHLKDDYKPYVLSARGLEEGDRGLLIWLLAMDEADVEFFRDNAASFLNQAFPGETPPPVLVVVPTSPTKAVADQFMRYQALESIRRDSDGLKEIGEVAYTNELDQTKTRLRKALGHLFGDEDLFASMPLKAGAAVVSQAYKANLLALTRVSIQTILEKLYELAYSYRPPEFFTDLSASQKKGPSPLREAVKTVARNLLYDRTGSAMAGMAKPAERLCKDYLRDKWHLLSTAYFIQEPDVLPLKSAWDYLESEVKPDDQEVRASSFVPNLLNSPFGFDFSTAMLLFTAWIGKHRNELRCYVNGRAAGMEFIEGKLSEAKSAQDFLSRICVLEPLSIVRRNVDKSLSEANSLVASIQRREQRSQDEARQNVEALMEIVNAGVCPEEDRHSLEQAIADLKSSHDQASRYDSAVSELLLAASDESDLGKLVNLRNSLTSVPIPGMVTASQPSLSEVQRQIDDRIEGIVRASCHHAEALNSIESADAVRNTLRSQDNALKAAGVLQYSQIISKAEEALEERILELKADAEASARENEIRAMTQKANLVKLYEYREGLASMDGIPPRVAAIRQQKLQDIQSEISQLEEFAGEVSQTYRGVDPSQADDLYERILRSISRYAGSDYEGPLNEALELLRRIKVFASELREVEAQPLRNPGDISRIQDRIRRIGATLPDYAETGGKSTMEAVQTDFELHARAEYENAEAQIADVENTFETSTSAQIEGKLGHISPFLTEDTRTRIDKARVMLEQKRASERIAQDHRQVEDVIDQIERLFLAIPSTTKRKECLERLQKKLSS